LDGLFAELLVPRKDTSRVSGRLLSELPVADVTIEDPDIEEIIGQLFQSQRVQAPPPSLEPVTR
jgi:ABC-2 type transport system ATP-binding protein